MKWSRTWLWLQSIMENWVTYGMFVLGLGLRAAMPPPSREETGVGLGVPLDSQNVLILILATEMLSLLPT